MRREFMRDLLRAIAPMALSEAIGAMRRALGRRERARRRRTRRPRREFCPEVMIEFLSRGNDAMLDHLDAAQRDVMLELREIFRTGSWALLGIDPVEWRRRGILDPAIAVELIEIGMTPADLDEAIGEADVRRLVALGEWDASLVGASIAEVMGRIGRPFLEALRSARQRVNGRRMPEGLTLEEHKEPECDR